MAASVLSVACVDHATLVDSNREFDVLSKHWGDVHCKEYRESGRPTFEQKLIDMPAFQVARSITINCPATEAFEKVRDFSTWTAWSPWLPADPEAVVTVSEDPASVDSHYHWEGDLVGEGHMTNLELIEVHSVRQKLDFIKPWKSTSEITWAFEPVEGGTKVTWTMLGSLPWFMFWMKGMMQGFISMDYDRGLLNLKSLIETGSIPSVTEVRGVQKIDRLRMFGIRNQCQLSEVGPAMAQSFEQAQAAFDQAGVSRSGNMLSVYTSLNASKGIFTYISGYVVDHSAACPTGLTEWSTPDTDAYVVSHQGPYVHLGNAWSIANQHVRYKKLKMRKSGDFEIYRTTPDQVAESEVVTDIYLPLKGS